jgi:hypothetical protein
MSRRRSRRRHEDELLDVLDRVVTRRRRASLLGLAWAWRKEFVLAAGIALLVLAVLRTSGIVWAIAGLSAAIGALSPPWSAQLRAFGCLLITPHRLRAGLFHARIQNRNGARPLIVGITSEPFGERVRLRCPAGVSAEDLYAVRDILRAACWAADVRIARDMQRSHLVTVDVIRRPGAVEPADGDQHTIGELVTMSQCGAADAGADARRSGETGGCLRA